MLQPASMMATLFYSLSCATTCARTPFCDRWRGLKKMCTLEDLCCMSTLLMSVNHLSVRLKYLYDIQVQLTGGTSRVAHCSLATCTCNAAWQGDGAFGWLPGMSAALRLQGRQADERTSSSCCTMESKLLAACCSSAHLYCRACCACDCCFCACRAHWVAEHKTPHTGIRLRSSGSHALVDAAL